jgi:hypothetical protein
MTLKKLDEEKPISTYDLANILEKMAVFMKELPLSPIRSVEYAEQEAWGRIDSMITGVNNRLVELEKSVNESNQSVDTAIEEYYRTNRDKIEALNNRLAELPKLIEGVRVPFNVKELVETAERMSNLSPEQWQRVVDLTKIFANAK